jgi:hypothetical protein
MARRVSGRATVADEARTRKSVHNASSRPPPKAELATAEIVGMGRVERRVKVLLSLVKKAATLLDISQHRVSDSWAYTFLLFRGHAQALFQIRTSTKGIIALAREDQSTRTTLAILLVQALNNTIQLAQKLCRNSIASLGTVKRQHCDSASMWRRDAGDLESSAQRRGIGALLLADGSFQPLSVGGDDAATG